MHFEKTNAKYLYCWILFSLISSLFDTFTESRLNFPILSDISKYEKYLSQPLPWLCTSLSEDRMQQIFKFNKSDREWESCRWNDQEYGSDYMIGADDVDNVIRVSDPGLFRIFNTSFLRS